MESKERRIVFIGGTYREFVLLCQERRIPPTRQTFASEPMHILGYCLCEECVEIVYGQTGPAHPEVLERVRVSLAIGKMHG